MQSTSLIEKLSCMAMCGACCSRQSKRYMKMAGKAQASVERDLDLHKFLHRQRLNTFMSRTTMEPRQRITADRMAAYQIRQSSDLDGEITSDFDPIPAANLQDAIQQTHNVFATKSDMDRRLIQAYQVKRYHEDRKRHRGKDSALTMVNPEA